MIVWRLARRLYSALDGEGARLYGGRWNSVGVPVVYTAASLALATLELLVHADLDTLPADLTAFAIDIPDSLDIEYVDRKNLPRRWRAVPAPTVCARFGDAWLVNLRTPILAIPSAIIPEEFNYLINPLHPRTKAVRIVRRRRFTFDPRLLV